MKKQVAFTVIGTAYSALGQVKNRGEFCFSLHSYTILNGGVVTLFLAEVIQVDLKVCLKNKLLRWEIPFPDRVVVGFQKEIILRQSVWLHQINRKNQTVQKQINTLKCILIKTNLELVSLLISHKTKELKTPKTR